MQREVTALMAGRFARECRARLRLSESAQSITTWYPAIRSMGQGPAVG
jgi:hypothetical protein